MSARRIANCLLASILLAVSLPACSEMASPPTPEQTVANDAPSIQGFEIVEVPPLEGDELAACELAKTAVAGAGHYDRSQIAGCDIAEWSNARPGLYALRLNAFCHEGVCGSVLLGWYAVDTESGSVWEFDVNEQALGAEITPAR